MAYTHLPKRKNILLLGHMQQSTEITLLVIYSPCMSTFALHVLLDYICSNTVVSELFIDHLFLFACLLFCHYILLTGHEATMFCLQEMVFKNCAASPEI